MKLKRILIKPLRDLALIFYDDLKFRALSMPRVGAGVTTTMVVITWYQILFKNREFLYFEALCTLCGGVWAAYSFKKWNEMKGGVLHGDERDEGS